MRTELPVCLHRGQERNVEGRWHCGNRAQMVVPRNGVPDQTCLVCPYAIAQPPPAKPWVAPEQGAPATPPAPPPEPPRPPCLFLGEATGEVIKGSCCGSPPTPTYGCDIFGRCSLTVIVSAPIDKPIGCCRVCAVYQPKPEPSQTEMPGFFQKAKNLAVATAQHLASGMRNVTPEQQAARMAICRACPEFTADGECRKCGCVMEKKTWWAEQICPDDPPRWGAE